MAYEVTATQKRPKNFNTLVGQEFVVTTLKNIITNNKIAHSYLFSGPRGVGKTSSARILAKGLNCEKGPTSEPCNQCESCSNINGGNSFDIMEIDGASNTSVQNIRQIREEVIYPPAQSRYKIYIIDEVHMLSNSAFNALLKTIEEPPAHAIFIFATTEVHKIPATVKSRCQQFHFRLIDLEVIKDLLIQACEDQKIGYDEDAILWIAKESTGSMRDAYTLFDQVTSFCDGYIALEKIKEKLGLVSIDEFNALSEAIIAQQQDKIIYLVDDFIRKGMAVEQFILDYSDYLRALYLYKLGIRQQNLIGYSLDQLTKAFEKHWSKEHFQQALDLLFDFYRKIKYSLNHKYELELLLMKFCFIKYYISPKEVLESLEILRQGHTPEELSETIEIKKIEFSKEEVGALNQNSSVSLNQEEKNISPNNLVKQEEKKIHIDYNGFDLNDFLKRAYLILEEIFSYVVPYIKEIEPFLEKESGTLFFKCIYFHHYILLKKDIFYIEQALMDLDPYIKKISFIYEKIKDDKIAQEDGKEEENKHVVLEDIKEIFEIE